jgi:hypothetical protein
MIGLQNRKLIVTLAIIGMIAALPACAEVRVPAFTAYLEPDVNGARVSSQAGIAGWKNPNLKVLWFGEIKTPGALEAWWLRFLRTSPESRRTPPRLPACSAG